MSGAKHPNITKSDLFRAESSDALPPDRQFPIFKLEHVNKKWCLCRCTREQKASFDRKIAVLGKIPWAEIQLSPKQGVGTEEVEEFTKKLPKDAPKSAKALAFRFFKKRPMVGFRDGQNFFVVWFDRNGKLYDHG